MSNKSSFSIASIQEELQLKALIHFSGKNEAINQIGDINFIKALYEMKDYDSILQETKDFSKYIDSSDRDLYFRFCFL